MHGHHQDRVLLLAGLVGVCVQRHFLKEARQGSVVMVVFIADDVGFKLFDMLDTALLLRAALGFQRGEVAGLVEQPVVQLGKGEELLLLPQVFHHLTEFFHRRRAARQGGIVRRMAHRFVQCHAVFHSEL